MFREFYCPMGKNKKSKNAVYEEQTNPVLESNDNIQEIPEGFLTADNFCVVQKKKNCKKYPDNQDFFHTNNPQFNLVKCLNTVEGNNCHMSFWTCKSSENLIDSSSDHNPINFAYESADENISQNLGSLSDQSVDIDLKFNSDFVSSSAVLAENARLEQLSVSAHDKNKVLETLCKSSIEKTVSHAKKKSKKKERKNKSEEEIEKILKDLGFVEESNDTDYTPDDSELGHKNFKERKYGNLNAGNGGNFKMSKVLNVSTLKTGKEIKSNINLNSTCNNSNTIKNDHKNFGCINVIETFSEGNNIIQASSQKRKEKRLKAKLKTGEKFDIVCRDKISEVSELDSKDITAHEETFERILSDCNEGKEKAKEKNVEESDKKSRKRPSKKQLALIQEALRKAKEDEERLKKEEEIKQKIAEEAEKLRQEKLKLEQEKKEKKKLKEKQRKEKMKAEGRLLSKSQKQSRARLEATLAALRLQGIDVPQICDKKLHDHHGPRLGNCKNFHRKRLDSCQSVQSIDSAIVISERQKSESLSSQESSGKDSLSDLPSSFDSTDDTVLPESDKGNFSCSEESDALDDIISINKSVQTKCKTITGKIDHNNVETLFFDKVKPVSSNSETHIVKFRSPIVCVLGHVDTGKTKILDYIRKTHVQDAEAGGITQQIGATMIPCDALKEKCKMVKKKFSTDMKIPGLLVIDTPGHESFSNLRSRGSSICDIAILVVDIMHGLEPQTIESINLLKKGKTPFVVALNKVDRIYGWESKRDEDIENTIMNQSHATQMEFKKRCQDIILQFANECMNASLFYENKDPRSYVSMVPTSAITGDGMGNILGIIVQLTQSLMQKKFIYSDELEATVLEVKAISGLGTTIDVILVNGQLCEGDTIVLAGQEGPIVTQIRSLLMPQPLRELRVKNPYIEYKAIKGAQGVKVTGKDLDKAIAGLPLFVAHNHSMIDVYKEEINRLFGEKMNLVKTSERGVYVQASTLGSLEALLDFLSISGIPYFSVKIGPVVKKDVMKASIMLEHDIQYAAILAFDVKVERDAQELADSLGVHIFHADIIYHLFDMYIKFRDDLLLKRQEDIKRLAVFPCKLRILPEFIFNLRDPITIGVYVEDGILKEGTPICIASKNCLDIGIISSIEISGSRISCARKGDKVCVKIDSKSGESPKTYGKHFSHEDLLISHISRQSIDVCKEHFRNELQSGDWHLMVELKKIFHIA